MLSLALRFELRALVRNRTATIAIFAFLAVGALAVVVGQRHVSRWRDAIATAQRGQSESVAEASRFFDEGAKGPPDRPWIDLTQPAWQDRYASTRVTREPRPLAGIAAGAVDPAPAAFRVSGASDPLAAGGYRIENPELDAGVIDVVFVLAVLSPLLIGVLGVEIGSRERQEGIERMVVVQAGELRRWLVARMLAVAMIAGSACAVVCAVAGFAAAASVLQIVALVGVALAYAMVWSGLMLAVCTRAESIRQAAFAFGMIWTLLCILIPTLSAEVSLSRVEADFAVADTLGARAVRQAAHQRDPQSVLQELYERRPELEKMPAASEASLDPSLGRHAVDLLLVGQLAARHQARREQELEAQALSEHAAWLSPVVALELGLERMAGVGPDSASGYRDYLMQAVEDRAHWVVTKAWARGPLTRADFETLQKEAPEPYRAPPSGVLGPLAALLIWGIASWSFALIALARAERQKVALAGQC